MYDERIQGEKLRNYYLNFQKVYERSNILCYIRFMLIPIFLILYIRAEEPVEYLKAAQSYFIGINGLFGWIIAKI